jgi:predicted membrane-bound dolichyl-phosphate-mannose-protein mannosyltransferase
MQTGENRQMAKLKGLLRWLVQWEYSGLCLFVLVTLALHFSVIYMPNQPIYDEGFYVDDARSILKGQGELRLEHPPLGKLIVAGGLLAFGDNPIGWRGPAVVFGAVNLWLFYFICRELRMSRRTAYFATFLLTFENMNFVQSSIAMLDVFSLTFTLASFLVYLRGKYPLAGLMVGLSVLAKLNGALAIVAIGLHWLIARRDKRLQFVLGMAIAPISFVALLPLFDWPIMRHLENPVTRINTMLSMTGSLKFTTVDNPTARLPWEWPFQFGPIGYWYNPDYYGNLSWTFAILFVPAALYLFYRIIKRDDAGLFGFSWFYATYLLWILQTWFFNRVAYTFYIFPTVGAICIGVGLWMNAMVETWERRPSSKRGWVAILSVWLTSLLHVGVFAVMAPISFFYGTPFFPW